jgi:hypothetical protein
MSGGANFSHETIVEKIILSLTLVRPKMQEKGHEVFLGILKRIIKAELFTDCWNADNDLFVLSQSQKQNICRLPNYG